MFAFSLVVSALLASQALASPISTDLAPRTSNNIDQWLCYLPFVPKTLCTSNTKRGSTTVSTPLGSATGVADGSGVRFSVKYGSASRWAPSTVATAWELPNGSTDPSAKPLMCAQVGADSSASSEDCLSALIYVPSTVKPGTNVPTFMWIHGGSFTAGSATDAGLDGMALATATDSIVVVVQYRLGALGFMAPSGDTNLAVKDMITCMQFLQKVLPSFGGSASKITLAGQSAGGNMIRALLAVPSASSLFQSAIIQSDPMDYGFLTTDVQKELQSYFNSLLSCSSTDTACLAKISLSDVLDASDNLVGQGPSIDESAVASQPLRPVHDGKLITSTLNDQSGFPTVSKPVLVTNVKDEAAPTIYGLVSSFMSVEFFQQWVDASYGDPKATNVLDSSFYSVPVLADGQQEDSRIPLTQMGTDSIWRCPAYTFARQWASNGGKAYVGQFQVGAHYPANSGISECQGSDVVCHQDDIEIVFGTVSNPTSAQSSVVTEIQARYKAFMYTGNPNPTTGSYATWTPAGDTAVSALLFGATGTATVGACSADFWGSQVKYDYQIWHD
ncbi:alpha beta-hydrolase [Peniophora sp. CONT]|nr:alpha beta-hydrolase [Peniophora sp. CONT]